MPVCLKNSTKHHFLSPYTYLYTSSKHPVLSPQTHKKYAFKKFHCPPKCPSKCPSNTIFNRKLRNRSHNYLSW